MIYRRTYPDPGLDRRLHEVHDHGNAWNSWMMSGTSTVPIPRVFFFFFFLPEGILHYWLKMCKSILHAKSMQLSLIFWQHFWGQARSCLPCHLPYTLLVHYQISNSLWFLQKIYVKLDKKSWKSTQTSRHVNPMAASFHTLYLLPQLNSARSSPHNIFCRVERAKQSRCKRWQGSEKKTIYRNSRVMLLY